MAGPTRRRPAWSRRLLLGIALSKPSLTIRLQAVSDETKMKPKRAGIAVKSNEKITVKIFW
jgi:hypothetical protein